MRKPVPQGQIIFTGIAPDIQNKNDQSQAQPLPQVGLNHIAPVFFHRLSNLGKTIAGQINKRNLFIDREEIDELRPPRSITGFLARVLRPTKVLIKDDLPTLERPTKAISGIVAGGYCGGQTALLINSVLVIFMS